MNRVDAESAAREAVNELMVVHARYLAPGLVARAQNSLALALLLKPGDEAGALRSFIAAFEADPRFDLIPIARRPARSA